MSCVKRILEVVEVLSVGNSDHHFAGKPNQLIGARIRHDSDAQLRCAPRHGAAVLQYESPFAAAQCSCYLLDGDVAGRILYGCAPASIWPLLTPSRSP